MTLTMLPITSAVPTLFLFNCHFSRLSFNHYTIFFVVTVTDLSGFDSSIEGNGAK